MECNDDAIHFDDNNYASNDWFFIDDDSNTDCMSVLPSDVDINYDENNEEVLDPLNTLDSMIMYEDECNEIIDPLKTLDSFVMIEDEEDFILVTLDSMIKEDSIKEVFDQLETLDNIVMNEYECNKEGITPSESFDSTDTDHYISKLTNENYKSYQIYIPHLENLLQKNLYITNHCNI